MPTIHGTDDSEVIVGTARDDRIFGLRGLDTLFGLGGDDTLDGGWHSDVLNGGSGFDHASYTTHTTRVVADLRFGTALLPQGPWKPDFLVGIEAVAGGSANDRLIGDSHANALFGNGGNDELLGVLGADTLVGGTGNDTLDGGAGNDTLLGGYGDDWLEFSAGGVLNGGAGRDAAVFIGDSDLRVNLNSGAVWVADGPRSQLVSIEWLWTGSGDDTVIGSVRADDIRVGDGANVVYAGAGDDIIMFESGRGLLNGGAGNDTIVGWGPLSGPQTLAGGSGDDFIGCGVGDMVTVSGGPGADTFAFGGDDEFPDEVTTETITDFDSNDRLSLAFAEDFPPSVYTGEVTDPLDLEPYELGYMRSGGDTHLFIMHGYYGDELEKVYSDITLQGYLGPLDYFGVAW